MAASDCRLAVLPGPTCAGERLFSFEESYLGRPRREAFYRRMSWVIELTRGLHRRVKAAACRDTGKASVFYVPSFFALLIAIHDEESLSCLAVASAALTSSSLYWRNIGYDHFYIHGMEYPVVSDFDFSLGVPRPRDEAHLWAVKAFYATTRNMMILTTGELDQGSLPSALAANLYATRRLVNVPFMLREDCQAVVEALRAHKLSFVGSVQDHNHERMLFLRASALEFGSALTKHAEGLLWSVNTPKLFLRALVPPGFGGTATHVLNNSRRERLALQRRSLKNLYRRTSICVVAPGDAPALGQRLSDILEAGCIPAVLVGPSSQPVLPLQGIVHWEEFAIIVRLGDDVAGARWAIRRILKTSTAELARRRAALQRWRPRLALAFGPECHGRESQLHPDAGELAVQEVLAAQAIWQHQLPFGSMEINSSACSPGRRGPPLQGLKPRCDLAQRLLPLWG